MRLTFYYSHGKKFDTRLAEAMGRGAHKRGDCCTMIPISEFAEVRADTDIAAVVGVKDRSGPVFKAHRAAGKHALFIDKGYTRLRGGPLGTLYWRLSVDTFQPLPYFQKRRRRPERWQALEVPMSNDRRRGSAVLFAGSSQKFCTWHDLGQATDYANEVLARARRFTDRPVVYRPKPSWQDAVPIEGYGYSPPKTRFGDELADCHCLITYGSNACFEALLGGVPTVVLGNGITKPLSSTKLANVDDPLFPDPVDTYQLACDLAYCQWTLDEMEAGLAWDEVRTTLEMLEHGFGK